MSPREMQPCLYARCEKHLAFFIFCLVSSYPKHGGKAMNERSIKIRTAIILVGIFAGIIFGIAQGSRDAVDATSIVIFYK